MMLEGMRNFEMLRLRPCPGRLDLGDGGYDETEMIEHLCVSIAMVSAMQREVVGSRGQVRVVRVGLPNEAHAENARIKFRGALDIGNLEREMAKSSVLNHVMSFQPAMVFDPRIGRNDFGGVSILSNAAPI